MAAPPPSAPSLSGQTAMASSPPKLPQQLPSTSDQLNPNPNPSPNPNSNANPSPSPSIADLMDLSQPQSLATAAAMQRPGSASRLHQLQFAQGAGRACSAGGGAAGQMSFGNMGLQHQQQLLAARAASMGGLSQMQAAVGMGMGLTQRQKGMAPGSQLNTPNMMQPFQGLQSVGTVGNVAMHPSIRANGPMLYNQQAFSHGQVRAQQLGSQTMISSPQKMAGQGLTRAPLHASLDSPLSGMSQNGQSAQMNSSSQPQPWLKQMQTSVPGSASQPYHIQQQPMSQKQMILKHLHEKGFSPQQIVQILQNKAGVFGQQHSISQQHSLNQQQLALQQMHLQPQQSPRISGLSQQKSTTGSVPETPMSCASTPHGVDGANQLLGKRKIQDLVAQIDPHGRLDPEVEDLLLEIADEFIDSVTTFACSLAKHRKSSVLEAKDVLLHLEKNWKLTIPGFSREDRAKNSLR